MIELAIYPFAAIGALFIVMQAIGHAINGNSAWVALSRWAAACLINGIDPGASISAWAHRRQHKLTERFINGLFRDDHHCAKAYLAEMTCAQNTREYRT